MELIAEGDSLQSLPLQEPLLSEGQEGEVRLYLNRMPTEGELVAIANGILAQGVVLTGRVTAVGPILFVPFRKELEPLTIIALAVGAIIVGQVLWQLFASLSAVPAWMWWLAAGGFLYYWFVRKKAGG